MARKKLNNSDSPQYMLGLDPSLQKAGFVVLNIKGEDTDVIDKGLLKTFPEDGILVIRLMKQVAQIQEKIEQYNIKFIGMEAPFYECFSTEMLFALNQFLHKMYYEKGLFVVCFPPQMLKKLVFPDQKVTEIHKPEMIDRAKTALNLQGHRLAEDVADAYWAGIFGKRFYKWYVDKSLADKDLGAYESHVFCGKKTYVRGEKKGSTDYTGIAYRENELFFDFEKIKRRKENGLPKKGQEEGTERGTPEEK